MGKKMILEQYSDEVEMFKLASDYYKKNGLEMTVKVLSKIISTLEKRETPTRAPKDNAHLYSHLTERKKNKGRL